MEFLDITSASSGHAYVCALTLLHPDQSRFRTLSERKYPAETSGIERVFRKLCIDWTIGLDDVIRIKQRMQEIIKADPPFIRHENTPTRLSACSRKEEWTTRSSCWKPRGNCIPATNKLGDTIDSYYGSLVPSTGYIRLFDIVKYYDGLLLRIPNRKNPDKLEEVVKQEKMLDVFQEYHRWNEILGISTVGDLNQACNRGMATDLINVSEALQEKEDCPHCR